MSVSKRGTNWHYRFMVAGTIHSGPCTGCTTFAQAAKYEAAKRAEAAADKAQMEETEKDIRRNRTVKALVENYRRELSGGSLIALRGAYALAAAKPSRREAGAIYANLRETYWNDFVSFIEATDPDVKDLSALRRSHCEQYVRRLVDEGRFLYPKLISPKTVKEIVAACKWVISRLEEDAGVFRNPWTGVILPAPDPVKREVFTLDELKLIWDGLARDTFCLPLFIIAANSGLTEGDICTLKWSDIDFIGGMLRRDRNKTGVPIVLPLLPELARYLASLPRTDEYVLPKHASMYLSNRPSVSWRVKRFLEDLGIKTTIERPGMKAVSVKDLHSLRHLFAYRAKRAGIPESTIQKMVGHAVLEMTKHYADHDTDDDLREQIKKLPALFVESGESESDESADRRKLAELLPGLPIEVIRRWLAELAQPRQLPR